MTDSISRRDAIKGLGLGGLGVAALASGACSTASAARGDPKAAGAMLAGAAMAQAFVLPPLPYDSLEPLIDDETLRIHHDKHHAGYVKGANADLQKLREARDSGDYGSIKAMERSLAFNGSGVVLHDLYWVSMWPKGRGQPSSSLGAAIDASFGSREMMLAQFAAAAKAVEASGWGILAWEPLTRRLVVLQAEKHQNLTIWGVTPILACDVWEHAYYLKYQNERGRYVDGWVEWIDWDGANRRFEAAMA